MTRKRDILTCVYVVFGERESGNEREREGGG